MNNIQNESKFSIKLISTLLVVNGSWCHWSPWNECTKSCGLGSRRRVRECTNPSPVAPGLACELPNGERSLHHEVIGPCNDQACIGMSIVKNSRALSGYITLYTLI